MLSTKCVILTYLPRHLKDPKNPDGLNFGMHVFVRVQRTCVYIYALRRDEILAYLFFFSHIFSSFLLFLYAYNVHMYIYMPGGKMKSGLTFDIICQKKKAISLRSHPAAQHMYIHVHFVHIDGKKKTRKSGLTTPTSGHVHRKG